MALHNTSAPAHSCQKRTFYMSVAETVGKRGGFVLSKQ